MTTEEEARSLLRQMVSQAQDRAQHAQAMVTDLEALRASGTHEGTTVVLGQSGALLEVRLSERLEGAPVREIEQVILRANAAAQATLQRLVQTLATAHYGADSQTAAVVTEQYDRLFPEALPEEDR